MISVEELRKEMINARKKNVCHFEQNIHYNKDSLTVNIYIMITKEFLQRRILKMLFNFVEIKMFFQIFIELIHGLS